MDVLKKENTKKVFSYIRIFFLIFVVLIIVGVILYLRWRTKVQKNFENERCKPHIKPIVDILGFEDENGVPITSKENYKYCLEKNARQIQLGLPDFGEFGSNLGGLGGIQIDINNNLGNLTNITGSLGAQFAKIFADIFNKFSATEANLLNVIFRIKDIFGKIGGIIYTIINMFGTMTNIMLVFFEKLPTMILTALVIALILSIIAIALSWLPWFWWMIFLIPFFVVIYIFTAIMIPFVAISKGMPYGEKCDDEDLCFHKNTKIIMENMSIKKIEDIKIGDYLFMGGKVLGIVKTDFKGLIPIYKNIIVTGSHMVSEKNKWCRIKDIQSNDISYINIYRKTQLYCLITENRLIVTDNNVVFKDYIETTNTKLLNYIDNYILDKLNKNRSHSKTLEIRDDYEYLIGLSGNNEIEVLDKNTNEYKLRDIKIYDILKNNNKVKAKIKLDSKKLSMIKYNGLILSKNVLINKNNKWYRLYKLCNNYIDNNDESGYHLITSNKYFTVNNLIISDFEEYNDNYIEKLILSDINNYS